ncbi:MAG TPA: hypothetical protein VGE22_12340 [Solimonas sp.]
MSDRLVRDAIILSKLETTYNTDAEPAAATDTMQVSQWTLDPLNAQNPKRDLIRAFLGGAEELVGDRYIASQYSVEMVGSGTAGTAPPWASQIMACGFAETLTETTRADYTLTSGDFDSLTNYYHDSGVKHLSTGTRGNAVFRVELGDRPMIDLSFLGIHNAESAASQPSPTVTAWKQPQAVTNANSADVVLGCTHSTTGAPALSSGTTYPSKGIRVDLGNVVNHVALLGGEKIVISQREVVGEVTLELTAAQEVTLLGMVRDATLTSIGFVHGTVTGRKVLIFMPYCQLVQPRKAEESGLRLTTFGFRATPGAGNDELRIVTSF